jgi:CbiX
VVHHPGASEVAPQLMEPGSEARWRQLQRLRCGSGSGATGSPVDLEPWIAGLASGVLPAQADLLAALWARLDRPALSRLLNSPAAAAAGPWLLAGQLELPALVSQPGTNDIWLEPLLLRQASATAAEAPLWLQLLGQLRDPQVALRLRQALAPLADGATPAPAIAGDGLLPLLPLLGLQRQACDLELLLNLVLAPGSLGLRRAALEGLALGLSSWPPQPLMAGLETLVADLDPALAAAALDLLARLPQGRRPLRRLLRRSLDPAVRARLRRRVRPTPLVLLVHGRQGGAIPSELQALAVELAERRAAPVLVQALTAEPPAADAAFWAAASRAGGLSLVPLLLFPGSHVRDDLPAIAAAWCARAQQAGDLSLRRLPFLGAWPRWQAALAETLASTAATSGLPPCWLHHPLEGPLAARFLSHLAAVLGCPGEAAPYSADAADLAVCSRGPVLLQPLTLAANRLSESLAMGVQPPVSVLPPLLEIPALRQVLLTALEDLP